MSARRTISPGQTPELSAKSMVPTGSAGEFRRSMPWRLPALLTAVCLVVAAAHNLAWPGTRGTS